MAVQADLANTMYFDFEWVGTPPPPPKNQFEEYFQVCQEFSDESNSYSHRGSESLEIICCP